MSEDKNHREELLKYLRGEMSNEEAHDFERKALNDPFLQEALEGAESISSDEFEAGLNELKVRNQRPTKTPVFWRIAAVVSLVIVSGVTLWIIQRIDPKEEVTQTETIKDQTEPEAVPSADDSDSKKKSIEILEEEDTLTPSDPKDAVTHRPSGPKRTEEQQSVVSLDETEISEYDFAEQVASEPSEEQDHISEVIAQPKNESGAGAAKRARSFTLAQPTKQDTSTLGKESEIDQEAALQEIVVSGYGDFDNESEGFVQAYPRPDFKAFKEYLEENLIYPEEARNKGVEGRVVLQITISPIGEITNIEVKRSLGSGCDEEAIRLVQEGPTWVPASNDGINVESKIRIRLKFEPD